MAMGALATEKLQLQKLFAAFIYHQPASWEGQWTAAWGQFGLRYASLNTITSALLCWVLHLHSIPNCPLSHHIQQPMPTDKSPMHLAGGTSNTNWVVSSRRWHHRVPCPLFFWLHLFALVYISLGFAAWWPIPPKLSDSVWFSDCLRYLTVPPGMIRII